MSQASDASDPLLGSVLAGKYTVVERLSGGGMGTVYKAEHTLMRRTVAIKVLKPQLLQQNEAEEFIKRFEREAQTSSRIRHPNAVTIFDFGREGNNPYLVMEYIEGQTLKSLLSLGGAMPLGQVTAIMDQVCGAATAAHRVGILHRDLKPDNIMVTRLEDGQEHAVVLDFGIAKVFDGGDLGQTMTQTGNILGTPYYMSPEQVLNKELDPRSDVYALSVILYQMLTGDVPFRADSAPQLMMRHVNDLFVPVRQKRPDLDLPESVELVVAKGMAKNRDKRFSTAQELAEALYLAAQGGFPVQPGDVDLTPLDDTDNITRTLLRMTKETGKRKRASGSLTSPMPPSVIRGGSLHPTLGTFNGGTIIVQQAPAVRGSWFVAALSVAGIIAMGAFYNFQVLNGQLAKPAGMSGQDIQIIDDTQPSGSTPGLEVQALASSSRAAEPVIERDEKGVIRVREGSSAASASLTEGPREGVAASIDKARALAAQARVVMENKTQPGALQQARGLAQAATEYDPNSAEGLKLLGIIDLRLGRLQTAEMSLRKSRKLAPGDAEVEQALTQVLERQGNSSEANEMREFLKRKNLTGPGSMRVKQRPASNQ